MKTAAIDSGYAWLRLVACLGLTTVGSAGMFVVVVALPAFQADFGLTRAGASVPYTMVMAGFGLGGIAIGRIVDRLGIVRPLAVSAVLLALSFLQAGWSSSVLWFNLAHVQIGCFGCATVFAPDRRHLEMVHASARPRGGHLRERQLRRRCGLAHAHARPRDHARLA